MKRIFVLIFIVAFIFAFPSSTYADCSSMMSETTTCSSNLIEIEADNSVKNQLTLNFTSHTQPSYGQNYCLTIRDMSKRKPKNINEEYLEDIVIQLDNNGSKEIQINGLVAGDYSAYLFRNNIGDYNPFVHDGASSTEDYGGYLCGSNQFIIVQGQRPEPTPTSEVRCLEENEDCVFDDSTEESRNKGNSFGFPVCDKGFFVCDYEYGKVIEIPTEQKNPPSSSDLAKQLAGNCGGPNPPNNTCCDLDILKYAKEFDSKDITGQGGSLFLIFFNFLKGILGDVTQEFVDTTSSTSENQTPCSGNLEIKLKLKTGSGELIAENLYQPSKGNEDGKYTVKMDCESLISSPLQYVACITNPEKYEYEVPKSQVNECTCIDPDAPPTSPLEDGVNMDFGFTSDYIHNQICSDQISDKLEGQCRDCYKNGYYFQPFPFIANDNKCVNDIGTARSNLEEYIKKLGDAQTSLNSSNSTLVKNNAELDNNQNVLGGTDTTTFCEQIEDSVAAKSCTDCVHAGRHWNRAGCTKKALASRNISNLCRSISKDSSERVKCNTCNMMGGIWTSIGCMYPNLETIIRDQVFGIGLGLSGIISLFCIIFAVFQMQTSAGNPEKLKKAQELITSCITGLIVVIFAIFILRVIGVDILRIPGFG